MALTVVDQLVWNAYWKPMTYFFCRTNCIASACQDVHPSLLIQKFRWLVGKTLIYQITLMTIKKSESKSCYILIGLPIFYFRYHYSEVNIFFSKNQFWTKQRRELHGNVDFLATCGGLQGLCLGMSVLSLLEIVYFCFIRFWFDRRKLKSRQTDNVIFVRKKRLKTIECLDIIQNLLTDYMGKTTVQGIKYVARFDLTICERIWWTIVVIISVFCCGSLIKAHLKLRVRNR
jgi:Amiloride-sensitive sodium channel